MSPMSSMSPMSQVSATRYLRRRIELTIAVLLMLTLVAAGALLGGGSGSRAPRIHYLGARGMELAALSGKLALTMTVTSPPTGETKPATSTTMPIRHLDVDLTAPTPDGSSGATGQPSLSAIRIVRVADSNTPKLFSATTTGSTYQSVTVTASRRSSRKVVEKLQLVFKPARINSDQYSLSSSSAQEVITLGAGALTLQYSRPS